VARTPEYDRDRALDAAAELFGRLGYAGCSIGDLVRALGVHRGSLYKAFGSKRGLFVEALRHHLNSSLDELGQELAVTKHAAQLAAGTTSLDLMLVAALEAGADPVVAALLNRGLTRLGAQLAASSADEQDALNVGLQLLACRLTARALPAEALAHQLDLFPLSPNRKD